jgi:hypothetical protein
MTHPNIHLNFGDALAAIKQGHRISRSGWNGAGLYLAKVTQGQRVDADSFWSKHNRDHAVAMGGSAEVLPYITMKTAQGTIVPWLASQTDLLAEDWTVHA